MEKHNESDSGYSTRGASTMVIGLSFANSAKALALFTLGGPLIGTLVWIAYSIYGASNIDFRAIRFFTIVGTLFALIPASIAGLMFLAFVCLPFLRKKRSTALVAIPLLGGLVSAMSSWLYFGIFEFATKHERSLVVVGSVSGTICSLIWLWLTFPSGKARLAQTTNPQRLF